MDERIRRVFNLLYRLDRKPWASDINLCFTSLDVEENHVINAFQNHTKLGLQENRHPGHLILSFFKGRKKKRWSERRMLLIHARAKAGPTPLEDIIALGPGANGVCRNGIYSLIAATCWGKIFHI